MPYGRSAGSARVRVFNWLGHTSVAFQAHTFLNTSDLRSRAIVNMAPRVARAHLRVMRLDRTSPARLLIHRGASPLSDGGIEERLLRCAESAVYDFDDAIQWETITGLRRLLDPAKRLTRMMRAADRVIAGNPTLADYASQTAREVVVIPSCIEPARYRQKDTYEVADPPRLGWIGSPSTEPYLAGISEALQAVHRQTGARLQLVGSKLGDLGPLESMIDRVPWSERTAEGLPSTWDVGLMPLTDRLYERGKCGYKLLEYGAAGLPSVASPVGINRSLVSHQGFIAATTQSEWAESILATLHAPSTTRATMGSAARSFVERHYSYSVWCDRWLAAVGMR